MAISCHVMLTPVASMAVRAAPTISGPIPSPIKYHA